MLPLKQNVKAVKRFFLAARGNKRDSVQTADRNLLFGGVAAGGEGLADRNLLFGGVAAGGEGLPLE